MTPHAKAHSGGPRVPRLARNVLAMTLACASATAAFAQQAPNAGTLLNEQARPKPEAPSPGSGGTLPKPAAPSTNEAAGASAQLGKTFVLHSIHFSGNDSVPTELLLPLVSDKIGQTVSLDDLNAIGARVAEAYRDRGYALAQVVIPPQDVTSGDVTTCASA